MKKDSISVRRKLKLRITHSLLGLFALIALVYSVNPKDFSSKQRGDKGIVTTYRSVIKNNPYSKHVSQGKQLVGKPFENEASLHQALKEGKVKRVRSSIGVIIDDLSHSQPYLVPEAYKILKEIGREFAKATNRDRIVITSLTRPLENQKDLTKTNLNASPNTSSHSYGVSFDIAYTRFNRNRKYSHDAHKAIEEILIKLQSEGRILVIREKQSACYHVTVIKN